MLRTVLCVKCRISTTNMATVEIVYVALENTFMHHLLLTLTLILFLNPWLNHSIISSAAADVLTIPNAESQTDNTTPRPARGMTMDEVGQQFGRPREIIEAVGEPPITRWIYDAFTVHFEYNYVIHAVVHKNNGPAP